MTNRHWYDESMVVRGCQGRVFLPVTILFLKNNTGSCAGTSVVNQRQQPIHKHSLPAASGTSQKGP